MSDIVERLHKAITLINEQYAEIERLKTGFLEYGNHKPDCRGGDGGSLCTCGYLNTWAAFTDPKP